VRRGPSEEEMAAQTELTKGAVVAVLHVIPARRWLSGDRRDKKGEHRGCRAAL
jgi:hypothetical protein